MNVFTENKKKQKNKKIEGPAILSTTVQRTEIGYKEDFFFFRKKKQRKTTGFRTMLCERNGTIMNLTSVK